MSAHRFRSKRYPAAALLLVAPLIVGLFVGLLSPGNLPLLPSEARAEEETRSGLSGATGSTIYHVAKNGSDLNPGTSALPFQTIQKAANIALAGDTVIVHGGIYREQVRPRNSGAPEAPIVYRAAPGEQVSVRGSNVYSSWTPLGGGVWSTTLSPSDFEDGFNPYTVALVKKTNRTLGQVFMNGVELNETDKVEDVEQLPLSWKASVDGLTMYANFGDVTPSEQLIEITVRKQLFAPDDADYGQIDWITVDGFYFSHSATQFHSTYNESGGTEMRGAIDTLAGSDWIIENNTIRDVKTTAIMLGIGSVDMFRQLGGFTVNYSTHSYTALGRVGYHTIRNNYIERAGSNGITGRMSPFTEITGNSVIECNYLLFPINNMTGGIKLYDFFDAVVHRNYFYNNYLNSLWIDVNNNGVRVTQNVFVNDHEPSLVFFELSHGPALADSNVFINHDVRISDASGTRILHNLIYNGKGFVNDWRIRTRPVFLPHTAEIGSTPNTQSTGIRNNKFYNNLFIGDSRPTMIDIPDEPWDDDNDSNYNVFLQGATASRFDDDSSVSAYDTDFSYTANRHYVAISFQLDSTPWSVSAPLMTSSFIGPTPVTNQTIGVDIDRDFFGLSLPTSNPLPGPFADLAIGNNTYVLWDSPDRSLLASGPDEDTPGPSLPAGWSSTHPGLTTVLTPPSNAHKAIRLETTSGQTVATAIYRPFDSRSAGTITAELTFRLSQLTHNAELLTLQDQIGAVAGVVYYDADTAQLFYTDGGTAEAVTAPFAIAANVPYNIRLVADIERQRAAVYIDSALSPAVSEAPLAAVPEINRITIGLIPQTATAGILDLEHISVRDMTFAPSYLQKFEIGATQSTLSKFYPWYLHKSVMVYHSSNSAVLSWQASEDTEAVLFNGIPTSSGEATVSLAVGMNVFTLETFSRDGAHRTYTFRIERLASDTVLIDETFDAIDVNQTPSDWTISHPDFLNIYDGMGAEHNRSLRFTDTVANSFALRAEKEIVPMNTGKLTLDFRFKVNQLSANANLGYLANASGSTYAVTVFVDAANHRIRYYNGATATTLPGSQQFTLGEWHHLRYVVDLDTETFDIYFDDLTDPAVTSAAFRNLVDNIQFVVFQLNNHATLQGSLQIDDVHMRTTSAAYSPYASIVEMRHAGGHIPFYTPFSPATTTYTAEVDNSVSSIQLKAISELSVASLALNGSPLTSDTWSSGVALSLGWNRLTLTVTSDYRSAMTYDLHVFRKPVTALLFENFNSGTTGSAPVDWTVSDLLYVKIAEQGSSAYKSLRLADATTTNSRASVSFDTVSSGKLAVQFRAYLEKAGGNFNLGYAANSSGTYATSLFWNAASNHLRYYNGSSGITLPGSAHMPVHTWYTIRYELDLDNGTYDLYVGDMTTPVVTNAAFRNSVSSVKQLVFQLNGSTGGEGAVRIDDVIVYML